MTVSNIEPRNIASAVDEYIDNEIHQISKHQQRTAFDGEGVRNLHGLAAEIYAQGYADGAGTEYDRQSRQRYREREALES